ncbi:MAG TPA: ACT domain-containing protein [Ruminococcaceae bacterium]|jgi:chorismate mutase|nr:ACT domain-containing protein [Oscillospiraceae bacterium]HBN81043.1 ACT domain-containing protein [Oscillospiraceae bacterium]
MKGSTFFLVDKKVLPKVYSKVVEAKQYLTNSEASSTSEAVRMAGISRSVFYKYKDSVYPYNPETTNRMITVQVVLYDRPGVLMALVSQFYSFGANILTINQNIPINGKALVSISARIDDMVGSVHELLELLKSVDGVRTIENISDQ